MPEKIKGDDLILSISDGVIYRPIACLTSNSLSETRNIIEAQTKCAPGVVEIESGTYSYELSAEGIYIDTTSSGAAITMASHDFLRTLMDSGAKFFWKMGTGLADTTDYFGTSILQDLEASAPAGDEFASFSATFKGDGLIVIVDPGP